MEEAQRDASVMTNFLPQLEKAFSAEILVNPELFGIGKSCTGRFLDKLRISDDAKDEKSLEDALKLEFGDQDFVKMPALRDLYEYRGDADTFRDESFRPSAREFQKIKEMAGKVARKLSEMGKTLLPEVRGRHSKLDVALQYCYLGEDFAKSIAAQYGRF